MRVLGASVLSMEFLLMGFAMLSAKDHSGSIEIAFGGVIAIAALLSAGLLKKKVGWVMGSIIQIGIFGYGFIVPTMFFIGGLFVALWVAAIIVGRKGEAARAALLASDVASPKADDTKPR